MNSNDKIEIKGVIRGEWLELWRTEGPSAR